MLLNSLNARLKSTQEPNYFLDSAVLSACKSHVVFVFFQHPQDLDVYVAEFSSALKRLSFVEHFVDPLRSLVEIRHYFLNRAERIWRLHLEHDLLLSAAALNVILNLRDASINADLLF